MQKNREAQEESLRRREQLIQDLELERETRRQEEQREEGLRTARRQEIDAQVGTEWFMSSEHFDPHSKMNIQETLTGISTHITASKDMLCMIKRTRCERVFLSAVGGAAAPRAVGGAVQETAGRGGGQGGRTPSGGGAEAGGAEDGQQRVPGEGKR